VRRPSRWRWRRAAATSLPILAFALLLSTGFGRDPRAVPDVIVGKRAPDFALPVAGGSGLVRLDALRGHVVVVNFWASWCAACVQEQGALVAAWQRYSGSGVVFLGPLFQDRASDALTFEERFGGGWPVLVDPGGRTALNYGVSGVPETFFIDRDGLVVSKQPGPIGYTAISAEIERLLDSTARVTPRGT